MPHSGSESWSRIRRHFMACDANDVRGDRATTTREKLVFPIAIAAVMVDGFDLQTHEQGSGRLRFGNGWLTTTALLWTGSFLAVLFIYIIINWLPSSLRSVGYSLARMPAQVDTGGPR